MKDGLFIDWYTSYLSRNGCSPAEQVSIGGEPVPVVLVVETISTLSNSKKNEIKTLAMLDEASGESPLRLLEHIAQSLEVEHA